MYNFVERMYSDNQALLQFLQQSVQVSFEVEVDNNFRKTLLLSVASLFEHRVTEIIINFVKKEAKDNEMLVSFVKDRAIKRKYHTFFDWDKKNVNTFFGSFGSYKAILSEKLKAEGLEESAKNFLELGRLRNELVHENFGAYDLAKTSEEIYNSYKSATQFVDFLERMLLGENKPIT